MMWAGFEIELHYLTKCDLILDVVGLVLMAEKFPPVSCSYLSKGVKLNELI